MQVKLMKTTTKRIPQWKKSEDCGISRNLENICKKYQQNKIKLGRQIYEVIDAPFLKKRKGFHKFF